MPTKYCVTSGVFSDPWIWATTSDGPGGAGPPEVGEDIVLDRNVTITEWRSKLTDDRNVFIRSQAVVHIHVYSAGVSFGIPEGKTLLIQGALYVYGNLVRCCGTCNIAQGGFLFLPSYYLDVYASGLFENHGTILHTTSDPGINLRVCFDSDHPRQSCLLGTMMRQCQFLQLTTTTIVREFTAHGHLDAGGLLFHTATPISRGEYRILFGDTEIRTGTMTFQLHGCSIFIHHNGNLSLSGDVVYNYTTGKVSWGQGVDSQYAFSGTADQSIHMPDFVEGHRWKADKAAGTLDLVRFEGYLQGRARKLIVRESSRIDLSGPAAYASTSGSLFRNYHGLKANEFSSGVPDSLEKRLQEAMDSCENFGLISIPEGKVLFTKTLLNHTGARITGNGTIRVLYDGLDNSGTIDETIKINYIDRRNLDLTLELVSGPFPLTVLAEVEAEYGDQLTFDWGDGRMTGPTDLNSARHVYDMEGTYTITVKVVPSMGDTLTASISLTVIKPEARLRVDPWQGDAPLSVTAWTTDSKGDEIILDWGDGTVLGPIPLDRSFPHTYTDPGRYLVELKVRYDEGFYDVASQVIDVEDPSRASAVLNVLPSNGFAPLSVIADASESVGSEYVFSWGDGTSDGPQSDPQAFHTYERPGYYRVVLSVSKKGYTASTSRGVVVNLAPPFPSDPIVPSTLGPIEIDERRRYHGIPRGNMPFPYRLTLAQGTSYMQDTLQLFCPMNESGRALTNGSALFLGRIAHSDGRPVVPSEIDTVFYTIFRLDDSDASVRIPIEGHTETEIDPEEILLSETILDENWVFDEEGYNFRYALDDSSFSPFPVSGRNYLVSFELKPGDSSPKIRVQYRVRVC